MLLLGALLLAPGAPAPAQDGPAAFVDQELCFELVAPGNEWQLQTGEVLAERDPRAAAAMTFMGVVWGYVVVKPCHYEADLLADAHERVERTSLEDLEVLQAPGELRFRGRPAVRYRLKGWSPASNNVYIDCLQVVHAGFVYELRLEAFNQRSPAGVDSACKLFHKAFAFRTGEPRIRDPKPLPDRDEVGWRIRGGRFQSFLHGIEAAAPSGWRLVPAEELAEYEDEPHLGFEHPRLGIHVLLSAERSSAAAAPERLAQATASFAEDCELAGERLELALGEEALTLHAYTWLPDPRDRHLYGGAHAGELLWKVQAWYPAHRDEVARPALAQALAAVQRLEPAERLRLVAASSGRNDPQDLVDLHERLSGGVYRHFELGLTWRKPAGLWLVTIGAGGLDVEKGEVLLLEELELGITGLVRARIAKDGDTAAFHRKMATLLGGERVEPREVRVGEASGLRSGGFVDPRDGTRCELVTAPHGPRVFELLLWGAPEDMEAHAAAVDAALAGFSLAASGPARILDEAGLTDHRMGFALRRPPEWKVMEHPDPGSVRMSAVGFQGRNASIAAYAHAGIGGTRASTKQLELGMAGILNLIPNAPFVESSREAFGTTCRLLTLAGPKQRVDYLIVPRNKTTYMLLGTGPADGSALEQAIELFSLLEP